MIPRGKSMRERAWRAGRAARLGLYEPGTERDNCGVGFVARQSGTASREVMAQALAMLCALKHRGGVGSDPQTGDGCGVLIGMPDRFLRGPAELGFALPPPGRYGVAQVFLPLGDRAERGAWISLIERTLADTGLTAIGWRSVPVHPDCCGPTGRETMPNVAQCFVGGAGPREPASHFERRLFRARKSIEKRARGQTSRAPMYVCSLSSRTLVYKGLLLPEHLHRFYADLAHGEFATGIAVVHQRFSTNTFPSWSRAHPYRLIAHNGEINTLKGNLNWMRAREADFQCPVLGGALDAIAPVIDPQGSDSAMLDNALELLVQAGRTLPHSLLMCMPPAWETDRRMPAEVRAFYAYHAALMEPWDGPALVAFTDGEVVGGCLDRNGLRPGRYVVTHDGLVVMSSEAGVLDLEPARIARAGRLRPGHMLLLDTRAGRVVGDAELKRSLARRRPYARWIEDAVLQHDEMPPAAPLPALCGRALLAAQSAHAYTREELKLLLAPMAEKAEEPLGAMGDDAALAVLSERPQLLFNYFKQLFAQVTNPPIDPIRETLVMSLRTLLGRRGNLLDEAPDACRQIALPGPVLSSERLARLRALRDPAFRSRTLPIVFTPEPGGLRGALDSLRARAVDAVDDGVTLLVLSDRSAVTGLAPIPSLLATAAVHHHLIRAGLRQRVSLIVESAEAREIMHFCLLIGYGASAINPYLAFDSIAALVREKRIEAASAATAVERYIEALDKSLLKVLSKMGISTIQSYQGAQVFEAVGLGQSLIDECFPGTPSRIGGIELDIVERECVARHRHALARRRGEHATLDWGGHYRWRRDGERHQLTPNVVGLMQHAVRSGDYGAFGKYSRIVDRHTTRACDIRGLFDFRQTRPVPIEEVEPAAEIVKRFRSGAMSFGSLSTEAHETLALAMNRLGARSNSGEGGEDPARYTPDPNGDSRSSAIKQVASGRFGVTPEYLLSAAELQIKMAQGAKPGEGGHLPGYKVDDTIARVRHAMPGVGLISPPPHHDIYSIEDLAQLIHDLKNANAQADVSVKLVSEVGVGTVAAGVAKAKADHIVISGHSGGTGASPLSSIKHAGLPWELGLAEAQQVLMLNDLRGRVTLEVDGQLKTGRDVVVAALLGAERFAFGTAALIASGCILMRVCHKNTCPVGIATQDPVLRKRFAGLPEHVANFMLFVAEEVRELMASLGFRHMDEMVGATERLVARADLDDHWKARHLDLSRVLHRAASPRADRRRTTAQDHALDEALDQRLIAAAAPALERRQAVQLSARISTANRSVGTMLSAHVVRRFGPDGLPPGSIGLRFSGAAGQSFGAFLAGGLDVLLRGTANDALGKGMAGGRIAVMPHGEASHASCAAVIGNVALYGATGGELYVRGSAGERFAVRNSGATAVVEGVGEHACEYMTGGTVVVLGRTGHNFGAGMSGGIAYVLDSRGDFASRCNRALVEVEALEENDEGPLHALIRRHSALTGSPLAWRIVSSWPRYRKRFLRVMATQYRRALHRAALNRGKAGIGAQ